jgi:hypothetical protein
VKFEHWIPSGEERHPHLTRPDLASQVVAQRQPAFLRCLDYADETCAAVVFLLERNRYGHGRRLLATRTSD